MTYTKADMNWFIEYGPATGLLFNVVGVIIIAAAQSRLFLVIKAWLLALDFYVETNLEKSSPIVRFEGWDKQMERVVPWTRRLSALGWTLIVIGVALQIPAALPK